MSVGSAGCSGGGTATGTGHCLCAPTEQCVAGTCQPACQVDPDCDDDDPCTTDTCSAARACSHVPNPGLCVGSLAFSTQPADSTGGVVFAQAVTVQVLDAGGNADTGATGLVTLTLAGGTTGAMLLGTTSQGLLAGAATFPDLAVDKAGTGYHLSGEANGLALVHSADFNIAVGPAAELRFDQEPANGRTLTNLTTLAVSLVDAGGNLVDTATDPITLSLSSGPAWATLSGTTSKAPGAGTAGYDDLQLDVPGSYTLDASASGVPNATSAAFTVDDAWQSITPESAWVTAIAVQPGVQTVFASTYGGLWKSIDGGAHWGAVPEVKTPELDGVAVDSGNANTLWAWGRRAMWHSGDGGATWVQASWPFGQGSLSGAAIRPGDLGFWALGFNGLGYVLVASTNGGTSFSPVTPALPAGVGYGAMAFDPSDTLWLATSGGVYRLANNAPSWTAPGTGLPALFTYVFAFDPSTAGVAYVGHYSGVYKTVDGGGVWTATGLTASGVQALWLDPANTNTLYAGVYFQGIRFTIDGGANWSSTAALDADTVLAIGGASTAVLAGTGGGMFRSTDGGSTWPAANTGLNAATVLSMAAQPGNSQLLLAGSGSGVVFRSVNGGGSWTRNRVVEPFYAIRAIIFDEQTTSRVWLAADSGVKRSVDSGVTWEPTVSIGGFVSSFSGCRAVPDTLWVSTSNGVRRSTDGGTIWTLVFSPPSANGSLDVVAADPTNPNLAYVFYQDYAGSASGLYRTIDGGTQWNRLSTTYLGSKLVVARSDPTVLWSGGGGVFRSGNGGVDWMSVHPPNAGQLAGFAVDPADAMRAMVGTFGSVFITTDGGSNWALAQSGLRGYLITSLSIDLNDRQTAYACSAGSLLRSSQGGF